MKRVLAILAFSLLTSPLFAVTITKTGVISKMHQCVKTNGAIFSTLEFKVDDTWFRAIAMGSDGTFKESVAQYNTILALYLAGKSVTIRVDSAQTNTVNSCGVTGTGDNPSAGTVYRVWSGSGATIGS